MSEDALQTRPAISRELALRIASALVLALATLLVAASGIVPFALLVVAVAVVLTWEWSRLVRRADLDGALVASVCGLVVAVGLAATGRPAPALLAVVATSLAVLALVPARARLLSAIGPIYAGLPAVSLVWLRSGPHLGLEAILFLLAVVWATDTGAFAAGRAIGGPKLCVGVSPNKTWSGLMGGVMAAAGVAWIFAAWHASPFPARAALVAMGLAVVSQLGDLFESAIKRVHGVKDASDLIPGHGGFMDRVDGLIFAAVAAGLYVLAADGGGAPGAALLALK